ncbi:alpha-hydroxy-acid oxidizing protein [Novosphingobium sp. FSY-8]|uniref:Alpha-hydroxy-acid oxidizing protein n=1 Tax=Novosphingobium ovatum TaxID=1908523 RepID=A0ABW9XEQ4_9SPHN|nr:alpha-hydroxy acid oxidase [Novosphingobium ovatum]NBC37019.1 alpha-hydroxy-acid oxidizing protein [Novosphingobium ovatum]
MTQSPVLPGHMLCLDDYAQGAKSRVEAGVWAWLEGGSGDLSARKREAEALAAHAIVPRVLADAAGGSTRLRLLGHDLAHPVILAPVGYHALVHPQGELATAAGALDTVLTVSTMASRPVEDIAHVAEGPVWFQLYTQPSRGDTLALIRRAEAAGCGALMVTLDTPVQPAGLSAMRAGFAMPQGVRAVHLDGITAPAPVAGHWYNPVLNPLTAAAPTWDDARWLREVTDLPLIAKGVAHPDDARRLIDLGWDAVALSTHGGRALAAVAAPLRLLPAMRAALGPDVPILLDGAIRTGADVFCALALGANAVMIGRPQLHALAVGGSLGVAHMLKLLREELELTMVLAGCPTIASITPAALMPV